MQERTLHEELAILQVIPALDPRLHHLGHAWEWRGHHRYRCPHCRTEAHDPDAVVLSCDELQAEQQATRVQRGWQPHQYRASSLHAWDRMMARERAYKRKRYKQAREAS